MVVSLEDTYISIFNSELDIISSLQSLQITLELAVVKKDLLHHVGPLDESKCLLNDNRCDRTGTSTNHPKIRPKVSLKKHKIQV